MTQRQRHKDRELLQTEDPRIYINREVLVWQSLTAGRAGGVQHPRPQSKRYSLISPPSHSPSHRLPAQTHHNNHFYLEAGHHFGTETTLFAIYLLFKEVREGLLLTAVEESFFTVRAPLCSSVSTQYIHFIQSNCLSHSIPAKSRCSFIRNDGIHGCIDLSSL